MADQPPQPWWYRLVPDTRSLVTLGMLALAWRLLEMVDAEPGLLKDAAFMTLATLVLGSGGIGAAVNFFYGSSRGAEQQSQQTTAALANAVAQNPQPQADITKESATLTTTTETTQ